MNPADGGGVFIVRNDNLHMVLHMNDMNGVDCSFTFFSCASVRPKALTLATSIQFSEGAH